MSNIVINLNTANPQVVTPGMSHPRAYAQNSNCLNLSTFNQAYVQNQSFVISNNMNQHVNSSSEFIEYFTNKIKDEMRKKSNWWNK